MKVIFMGTPDFAVYSLKALLTKHEVVAVVTQPDKPKGRGKKRQFTPVKELALEHKLHAQEDPKYAHTQYSLDMKREALYEETAKQLA